MMNDPFVHEQAGRIVERIAVGGDETMRIQAAYVQVLGRNPLPDEIESGRGYLRNVGQELAATAMPPEEAPKAALASLVRVLLSSNEFMFID